MFTNRNRYSAISCRDFLTSTIEIKKVLCELGISSVTKIFSLKTLDDFRLNNCNNHHRDRFHSVMPWISKKLADFSDEDWADSMIVVSATSFTKVSLNTIELCSYALEARDQRQIFLHSTVDGASSLGVELHKSLKEIGW